MTTPLQDVARGFAAALPASVELPAGAGKTELLAATVEAITDGSGRVLVLTHTNAGVHAIRSRLARFGVQAGFKVMTITSFGFTLARSYPDLAQLRVPPVPQWSDSSQYIAAAIRVARSRHIVTVLSATYSHLLVDEYQDCNVQHHELVEALTEAIPLTGVLGDPLQAIFGFAEPLPSWPSVAERFPEHKVPQEPWRWVGHNEALGKWLTELRAPLKSLAKLSFEDANLPPGMAFVMDDRTGGALRNAALMKTPPNESVLVIAGPGKEQARAKARILNGAYSVMEEIAAEFMHERLAELEACPPEGRSTWLFGLVRSCCCPYGGMDSPVAKRLSSGRPAADLDRPGFEEVLAALDSVTANPTLSSLANAMDQIAFAPSPRIHSHEAWSDILAAIRGAIAAGGDLSVLTTELAKSRDRIRHSGRSDRRRVVSRTLLVKGLEYDHVIVADLTSIRDANNLYVALTRARKSITVIGPSRLLQVTETPLTPRPKRNSSRRPPA
ncbi:MAG: UvrD-helicase domain-containing protein [Propionicimonas sp.]